MSDSLDPDPAASAKLVLAIGSLAICSLLVVGSGGCLAFEYPEQCSGPDDCFAGQRCDLEENECVPSDDDLVDTSSDAVADTAPVDTDAASGDTVGGSDSDGTTDTSLPADTSTPPDTQAPTDTRTPTDADTGPIGDVCTRHPAPDGSGQGGTGQPECPTSQTVTESFPVDSAPVNDLAFWLRSDHVCQVSTRSGDVSRWPDLSRNDRDFVGKSKYPPSVKMGGPGDGPLEGRPFIQFTGTAKDNDADGTDQATRLKLPNADNPNFVGTSEATIFFVVRQDSMSNQGQLLSVCNASPSEPSRQNHQIRLESDPGRLFFHAHGHKYFDKGLTVEFPTEARPTTEWQVLSVVLALDSLSVYQNGCLVGKRSPMANSSLSKTEWVFNAIGVRCTTEDPLEGSLAEVIFFDKTLDGGVRRAVEGYLLNRYFGAK